MKTRQIQLKIEPIPAFNDNYLWIIHDGKNAIIVDPGDDTPVLAYLNQHKLNLSAILLTHHHDDHIGGVAGLLNKATQSIPVYGPLAELQSGRIPNITYGCQQGDPVVISELDLSFEVIEVPGHTRCHIAYYNAELSSLFCGDTLFAGGCGRLFEGTPTQMLNSLQKLTVLPGNTKIYCAHEYTLANLRFALAVEPNNVALQTRLKQATDIREKGLPTIPSQLNLELQTNPFLRSTSEEIIHTLQRHNRLADDTDEVAVFTAVREWKNTF